MADWHKKPESFVKAPSNATQEELEKAADYAKKAEENARAISKRKERR